MVKALSNLDHREKRIVEAVRNLGGEATRREIAIAAGIPRTIVSEIVSELVSRKILEDGSIEPSSGGRPPRKVRFNPKTGHLAAIVIGGYRSQVALGQLDTSLIAQTEFRIDVNTGPRKVLDQALKALDQLQAETADIGKLMGIAIGLPAPVEAETGFAVAAPLMGSWEGFDTKAYIRERLGISPIIENDVNLTVIAEHHWSFPDSEVLLAVKCSTGFGSGVMIRGTLIRGATGVAGDIGHLPAVPISNAPCRCTRTGCAEAIGGGWAMVEKFNAQTKNSREHIKSIYEFVSLCREKNPVALTIARQGAQAIGLAIADAVSLLNPDTVVISGYTVGAGDFILSTIREMVYQRSSPLATKDLKITQTALGDDPGILGALLMASNLMIGTPIEQDITKAEAIKKTR